jgi:hypothetical protein
VITSMMQKIQTANAISASPPSKSSMSARVQVKRGARRRRGRFAAVSARAKSMEVQCHALPS